jgi:hypothetical protein
MFASQHRSVEYQSNKNESEQRPLPISGRTRKPKKEPVRGIALIASDYAGYRICPCEEQPGHARKDA